MRFSIDIFNNYSAQEKNSVANIYKSGRAFMWNKLIDFRGMGVYSNYI